MALQNLSAVDILRSNPLRVTQHVLDFLPDSSVQQIGAQWRIRAHASALGSADVVAAAPVIGIGAAPAS
jgi:hypothetical protein